MKKYDDHLEKILTAIFGGIGVIAIFINLHIKGYGAEYWLDAIKDIASLIVVIAVFLVASKIFKINKKKDFNFNEKFEEYLIDWASRNKYLIDISEIKNPKGKEMNVRTIDMICNHELMLECIDVSKAKYKTGAFLYLPKSEELGMEGNNDSNKFSFKINKSMFKGNASIFDNYEDRKSDKAKEIAKSIRLEFNIPNLTITTNGEKIDVDFSEIEKTDENARNMVNIVEFVKTLFLAIA
jgi:hypothetical protein